MIKIALGLAAVAAQGAQAVPLPIPGPPSSVIWGSAFAIVSGLLGQALLLWRSNTLQASKLSELSTYLERLTNQMAKTETENAEEHRDFRRELSRHAECLARHEGMILSALKTPSSD